MRVVLFTLVTCSGLMAAPALKDGPPRALVVSSNKSGNWEIYLVQPGGGEPKQLTDDKASDTEPIWAPDGKRIAFVSDRDGGPDIWTMNADGADPKPLTKKSGGCTNLRWSPDGGKIAYVGPQAGVDQIFSVDVATGKVAQLTDVLTASRQPAWSPDGKKLSFSSHAGRYSTYLMDADGDKKAMLTDGNGGLDAAWSPDGKRLAYVSVYAADQGWRLYTVNADGTDKKQLTKTVNTYGNVYPRWSPDGKHISFGDLVDGVLQTAVMPAGGGDATFITSTHLHAYTRWSPDGKMINCTRMEKGKPWALWVCDADGRNGKELLSGVGVAAAEWKPK